jgi:excisionase family DNA binding protein
MPKLSTNQKSNNNLRRLLSTRQAGEYLGVSSRTIRSRIYSGDLPVLRCFKSFRLDKADLDAYIASNKEVL